MKTTLSIVLICLSIFTLSVFAQTKEAQKIYELTSYDCETLKLRSFDIKFLINDAEDSKGYVIVYDGKDKAIVYNKNGEFERHEYILPKLGQLNSRIRGIRGMFRFIEAPLEKIKIINGGFRENFSIEFWIVPNEANPPKLTPTLEKMKYRKGKVPKFIFLNC